jgi:prepilin-type N-terminal cleavage/methylation domain-containing protein
VIVRNSSRRNHNSPQGSPIARPVAPPGFSLVELLVVIGIIGILVSLLMPALSRARQHANSVKCQSNLHQVAAALLMYSNTYRGWLYPVGGKDPLTGLPRTLGLEPGMPREQRWPSLVFDPPVWNPPVLTCPSDFEPAEEHSYVLNKHLADRGVRFGRSRVGQLDSTQVVVMGEKVSSQGDYYMSRGNGFEPSEFFRVVEAYRHGAKLGSNYLFLDMHVSTQLPSEAMRGVDPWDVGMGATPTTQPGQ